MFIGEDFLLRSDAARRLYHEYAEGLPITDYHCHISPKEIAEDKHWDNITEVWLGGDHYKWRLMRLAGFSEGEITGAINAAPYEVFERYAAVLSRSVGSPLYHWSHFELKRFFGVETELTRETAKEIYERCNETLKRPDFGALGLIEKSRVKLICTTDDPLDDLSFHKKIAEDKNIGVKVLPAFRPDRALNIEMAGFAEHAAKLGGDYKSFKAALLARVDYFADNGCKAADHGITRGFYEEAPERAIAAIYDKALGNEAVTELEAEQFRTALLLALAEKYCERGIVSEIHFGCVRNNNTAAFEKLGADTGFDAINTDSRAAVLAKLLNAMNSRGALPKTILFSLNHYDNEALCSIAGCFSGVQLGAAWWFNDTKAGMEKQLADIANYGLLTPFVGMLTDSRSFLSYPRHEYFRRILCDFLGGFVTAGEYPPDYVKLGGLVKDICYNNAVRFFGFRRN